ncbi:sarcosine oxidase [Hypoxylon sp. NC1633]|nr:sarcosine oxidase [Hypoxylon sp. NC1633]
MSSPSYLIIGAGCFGASTARALKQARPTSRVTLLSAAPPPDPYAAAHDHNKIVRAAYDDPLYAALALEALASWSGADPAVAPFFRQAGTLWSTTASRAATLLQNYEALGAKMRELDFEEVRDRFPVLADCRFADGAETCVFSPDEGWAEAEGALAAVVREAVESGVKYEVGQAARLRFGMDGACIGVETVDERTFEAQRVVLCTGAYTPWLLAESAPGRLEMHAGERMVAAAVLMCLFKVPPGAEGLDKFDGAPVMVYPFGEFPAECIPPGSSGTPDLAKCTHEFPYTRLKHHGPSGQEISVPPLSHAERMTWTGDLPDALKAKSAGVRDMLFGDAVKGMTPESYRLCWDSATPDEDWIISPHPAAKNLYIAAGGSFHAFKFLPVIGKYVVQMLHGELSEEHMRRWAWDREFTPILTTYTPRKDLRDVPRYYD